MEKYVIFDVDGTLNQTELYAVEAYQKAMLKRGRTISRKEVISFIGLSPIAIVKRLFGNLDDEELKAWREDIETFEFELIDKNAKSFEGIEDALKALKSTGYSLAICSNAFSVHIEHVLKMIELKDYFDIIGSLEMGKNKIESLKSLLKTLKPSKACMVGDRRFDLQAAQKNGIPFIGCAYGYAPDEIKDAQTVVMKPLEISEAVKRLI